MNTRTPAAPSKRLFLALWPKPEVRAQIAQISAYLSAGRRINPANLHMTLVFLGVTKPEQQACYEQALAQIHASEFELYLDQLGYWRRAGIVWLAPQSAPNGLSNLLEQIKAALQDCGFRPEKRPFKAHITLARKFPAAAWPVKPLAPDIELQWRIARFSLLESVVIQNSVRYNELSAWHCH